MENQGADLNTVTVFKKLRFKPRVPVIKKHTGILSLERVFGVSSGWWKRHLQLLGLALLGGSDCVTSK